MINEKYEGIDVEIKNGQAYNEKKVSSDKLSIIVDMNELHIRVYDDGNTEKDHKYIGVKISADQYDEFFNMMLFVKRRIRRLNKNSKKLQGGK